MRPLNINKEAVRVLATAVGVREAARQMGLKEDTVKKWSAREQWFPEPVEVQRPPTMQKMSVPNVPNAAVALLNTLEEHGKATRFNLSKGILRASKHVAALSPDILLAEAPNIKALTASAAQIHGWAETAQTSVRIALFTGGEDKLVIDV